MRAARADSRPAVSADAVVVAAPSGEVLFSNRTPSRVGRRLAELAPEVELLRPDGRRYAASEWPLARSLATGVEVGDE